ncbi:class I SAM-dependent methyltransferase [Pseudonocardia hispaniensis]|uniref:Class I SAM-dependent methyltransferase n=1 Tax=Pseudonocardia hispaniensis TaxID=904933 RepID=A0ABW1J4S4_9PSEU
MDSNQVREFFERVAGEWDQMHQSFYDETVVDALAERAQLTEASTVVDVGTGTGFVAGGLAPRVRRVIGVDSSPAMLAVARDNLTGLGIGNVELTEAPVDALPLKDRSADAAVANMVLHHAPDPAAMIAEMARVVRPGGTVVISDCVEHDHEWMRTQQADRWLGFSAETIAELFERAGLTDHGYAELGTT